MPLSFMNCKANFKFQVRQTVTLCKAPAEVFIASALIAAAFCSGIKIVSTPAHSAVRAMAPKFLTSVILSNTNTNGFFPSS